MQRPVHEYRNASYLFSQIESLYAYVSDVDFDDAILWLDESFKDVCSILETNLLNFRVPTFKDWQFQKLGAVGCDTGKEVTVCLSGGKDSAAVAFYYKKLGYTVHLYHAHGVNKAYGDEKLAAAKIADYLGCDLFIDNVKLTGTHTFVEHPLKNYIIANGAIHYCLANGYSPVIAFGNFANSSLDTNAFEVCGGDCIEMWRAYEKIICRVVDDFKVLTPLNSNADTFELLSNDWTLFQLAVSCMSPFRFRAHWKHRSEQTYGLRLFDNRCGVCWKCCLEYMWLADHDKIEYNEAFYIHCYEILERTIFKETGRPAESPQFVWDNYMFYPISESKAGDMILARKIKRRFV